MYPMVEADVRIHSIHSAEEYAVQGAEFDAYCGSTATFEAVQISSIVSEIKVDRGAYACVHVYFL